MHKIIAALKTPRGWLIAGAILAVAVVAVVALKPSQVEASNSVYTVRKGDFLISVVEGGTLQAVNEVAIRNEVEGTSRIIYIVPEGSYVKKGDLLVELDSASAQDQVNQQLIAVEKAQFALVQAEEQLAIQKSVVESDIRAAELKLSFAKLDLKKFLEGQREQELTQARNQITTAQEKLAIDREKAMWSERLEAQGFETKANLDRDRLTVTQSELSYQMATNNLWMLENFDLPKQEQTFASAVHEAEKELDRVKHQGTRKLAQFEADVHTQKITLDLSKAKLERDQRNLAAGKILAPQDGLVVYSVSDNRFSSESLVEEGATVRNRQILIKLPDVSQMKLTVKIHESHINMVSQGQPAFVVLDSMPDRRFRGHVSKVGLLPDTSSRWGNPNLKVYATEILVTDPLPDIKPGVSARAEIIITNLQDVISVPLQAVTTRQGKPVVYLAGDETAKPVEVQVGLYNTKFIEVTSGLNEGDRVLLSPPFDTKQQDLGGAILAEGEKAPTNTVTTINPALPAGGDGPARPFPAEGDAPQVASAERPPRNPGRPGLPTEDPAGRPGISAEGQPGQSPRRTRPDFEEMRKRFDKNGDGELDETERQAMRETFGGQFGGGRRRPQNSGEAGQGPGRGEDNGEAGGGRVRGPRSGSGGNPQAPTP